MLHIFTLPNLENILGYYQFKTEWKVIKSNGFEIQPVDLLSECHKQYSFAACLSTKFGQLAVINNHWSAG